MAQWIAGITRGHNAGICLLKDGEIVFALQEERLTREKYDGGPYASLMKVLEYTDHLDYLVIAHTKPLDSYAAKVDFSEEDVYTGLARKLGLISRETSIFDKQLHPQVIDLGSTHHKLHAACAFYRSGFESAVSLVVDGHGTFIPMHILGEIQTTWELETIFECSYPSNFKTIYKHQGGRGPWNSFKEDSFGGRDEDGDDKYEFILDENSGIVNAYEAVTQYCGWPAIEAGKTMGLFPYGKPNDKVPTIYSDGGGGDWKSADRNVIVPTYPNAAVVNEGRYAYLRSDHTYIHDVTRLDNRRDMAYAIQTESQQMVLDLIRKAVDKSGNNNVVLSGGYGLNCVANYYYISQLDGINLYVEPVSDDSGTAIGAALYQHYKTTGDTTIRDYSSVYLGPEYDYSDILS